MECDECKEKLIKDIFPCDTCKITFCKSCAGLTASEVKVLQLKERVMTFHCKKCESLETTTLLQSTIKDKLTIISSKDEIITLLKNRIDELEHSTTTLKKTYSQIAQTAITDNKKLEVKNLPSLIIKPKVKQNAETTSLELKAKINPSQLKVAIKNTRNTANGNIIIKCSNRNDLNILKLEAESKMENYDIQLTKMRKPRFVISGYNGDMQEILLEGCIREQNNFIDEEDEFKITYIKLNKKQNSKLIFGECSPELFHKLIKTKRIFIGWESCAVYEDLGIPRCYKCQEYYHKSDVCPNNMVCEICSNEHDMKNCPRNRKSCRNCMKTNEKFKLNYDINHTASDSNCPSYQYLVKVLRSRTDYGNGAPP